MQMLGLALGAAFLCLFLPPLLSGSNHKCPVLREQDLARGPGARAVPAFARKYNVDCTYCHTMWPQLNRTGYIFRRLGYRMPYEVPVADTSPSASGPTPPTGAAPLPPRITSGLKQGVSSAPSPEQIAEGEKVFTQMQCFTCHVNGQNVIDPSKPIKGPGFRKKYPEDAQIAQIIRHGVPGTAMPAYNNARLSDDQLTALIVYVRSLTPQQ